MEIFRKARVVRLRSHHDKYLFADDDEESVSQDRDGRLINARWTVEIVEESGVIRLRSCFDKYLTASNLPLFLGMTGKKVIQTLPRRLDSSTEWEPLRDGVQVRFRTRYGQYLRANGGVPPWRNSITHDIPHRTATQDWVLWDVDILETRKKKSATSPPHEPPPPPPVKPREEEEPEPGSPTGFSLKSPRPTGLESDDTFECSPNKKEGRLIYYKIGDKNGNIDEAKEEKSFTFIGTGVEELNKKLEEETGLSGVCVCSKNPLNGKLYPLRLHLPPNNTTMHVVVVPPKERNEADSA